MSLWQRLIQLPSPAPGHCANCGAALADPRPRFCGACGQETEVKAPTLGEFLQQFGGAYLSTEGALWRTLWRLFVPGQLTLEYFAGRRRHYVLPLRLYLTLSVVLLLALRLTGQLELPVEEDAAPAAAAPASAASGAEVDGKPQSSQAPRGPLIIDETDREEVTILGMGPWQAGMHQGKFYCKGFSEQVCKRMERRLSADPATMRRELSDLPSRALDHLGQAMFVLLPAFALWLKLLYVDKRRRYTEHLVFALHQHAFWFAMLALLTLKSEPVAVFCALAMVVHPLIALHRVYGTRWWSTLPRAFGLLMAYSISLGLVLAAMFIYLFAS